MKIKATIQEIKEVQVNKEDLIKATIELINKKFDIPKDSFIEGNNLVQEKEYYGSHSFYRTITIREASDIDKQTLEVIKFLRNL